MINLNNLLVLGNAVFAFWVTVTTISCLMVQPKQRDLRPLVFPVFVLLAYIALQSELIISSFTRNTTCSPTTQKTVWLIVESGFIASLYLLVNSFKQQRSIRT